MNDTGKTEALVSVEGKPVSCNFGGFVPSMFGWTVLSLFRDQVVEQTKRIVGGRDSELLLSEVDSAEIVFKGNPLWIGLGFLTIALYGLGILFFILYVCLKHKFLIIHSKSNLHVVSIKGDDDQYRNFLAAVLQAAIEAKRE